MDEMIRWLRQQLTDDEKTARAATPGPWRHKPDKHWRKPGTSEFEESVFAGPAGDTATSVAGTGPSDDPQSMADAAHIARHDPAAVLADIAAKRELLTILAFARDAADTEHADSSPLADAYQQGVLAAYNIAVQNLARAYRHRPGWKQEWEA